MVSFYQHRNIDQKTKLKMRTNYWSFASTYRYRAHPFSMSMMAELASDIGRTSIQGRIFFFSANSSISRISFGLPMPEPAIWRLEKMREKGSTGSFPSSGAPS
ncbi:hypothetical protein VTN31DRAFT_6642 [Thermomyces dupontii]|uniref:uncharacterized protein n=1 Tax=Talaromyces thermophilus TaxID=28565 RepID=UPI00374245E9